MSPPALDGSGFLLKKSCGTPSSSFSKKPGPPSNPDVFTPPPSFTGGSQPKSSCTFSRRETQMSLSPATPVERFEAKNSQWPSRESAGAMSLTELLTVDPRLTGVPHGQLSSAQARWDTQMLRSRTMSPGPSGRFEAKYRLRPSLESAGGWSL